ncbi:killer toxin Kp4/SMK [Trichoderma pleuroticola]
MKFGNTLFTIASAITAVNATGINCNGSGLCSGNKGLLSEAIGELRGMDQGQTFSDGQHITCVESAVTIGTPSLCIFYQKTGRQWSVGQTVNFVQSLLNHGCAACGSVPVDPGNNVNNGELTANMVTNAKRHVKVERAPEPVSKAEGASEILARSLGINCRGSSSCGVGGIANSPKGTLSNVFDAVNSGPEGNWGNGQQIACVGLATGRLCAFYQNVGNRVFSKGQTLNYLNQLLGHGCRVCGSVPTDSGNNVDNGELTVNFVA